MRDGVQTPLLVGFVGAVMLALLAIKTKCEADPIH